MRAGYAALAALALAACSSGGSPHAAPTTPPRTSTTAKPKPKPSGSASATPKTSGSPSLSASPTPAPVTGAVLGTSGALVRLAPSGQAPRKVAATADCATAFPDMQSPVCGAVKLDGGSLLWGSGQAEGATIVQLLTFDEAAGGYLPRYEGRDDRGAWDSAKVAAYALAGHGTDAAVVTVRRVDGTLAYDVLTWFAGGPLVLRAHRTPLPDGRVGPAKDALAEYVHQRSDGAWVRRVVAWDGRHFRLAPTAARVPESAVPPA